MGGTSKRKAWNEAMSMTTDSITHTRSSNRQKKNRRENVRKITIKNSLENSTIDSEEHVIASRIDRLEGVINFQDEEAEQEEYIDSHDGNLKRFSCVTKRYKIWNGIRHSSSNKNDTITEEYKPRSFSSIIVEEASLGRNGICHDYIKAEAKPTIKLLRPPERKICPVTGLFGLYVDPKSGIPFSKVSALKKIRDHPPPWLNSSRGITTSSYFEALKSLKHRFGVH